tara:strand:+ start:154 stop:1296 length:1143 start_codon:yes stop_codon:yes gene_type:complete
MKKKIFYWCPFIDKVATVKSVINSAYSISKYDNDFVPVILNTVGEWNNYKKDLLNKNVHLLNLTNSKILADIPKKKGFVSSRVLYFKIIFKLVFPLIKFLKQKDNDYLIIHLITSLPLFLNIFFNKKNVILRISGLPKFNFFRKLLWNNAIKNIKLIYCPTIDTRINMETMFPKYKSKFKLLRDPIISIDEIQNKKKEINEINEKDYFLSIGRLTKQKNYMLLLKLVKYLNKKNINKKFIIIGEGEEKAKLLKYINENNLNNFVKLIGYKKNIFSYLKNSNALISTSLWEDPGFTIIEAAYCGIPIISSDCPNGPKEILNNGDGGYLYNSNSIEDLINVFNSFLIDDKKEIFKKRILTKKISGEFTLFSHYKNFKKTIND